MKTIVISEHGYNEAMLGLSLNKNQPVHKMFAVAEKLAHAQGGHNKFLESICVWLDITAPRYFWSEFDTYRVGVTKQSESTMHTITKRELSAEDFEGGLGNIMLDHLNGLIYGYQESENVKDQQLYFLAIKRTLPESFLQRRVVNTNYKSLQNIINQRSTHRLPEWKEFITSVLGAVDHPQWLQR